MGLFSWIVVGAVAGVIAKLLMPGKDPGGWILTILLGIVGAMVGGFVVGLFGVTAAVTGINLVSIATAALGAFILLGAYRLVLYFMHRGDATHASTGSGSPA
jgi:uncharacterized membrane protein YeaQ/YmgE (transglycosylase-associated protein family)